MIIKDVLKAESNRLRDALKKRWGALTDKDLDAVDGKLDYVDGKLDQLPRLLQARYGYTREQAEKEIELFLNMKPERTNPLEVVRETLSGSTPDEEAHLEKRVYKE